MRIEYGITYTKIGDKYNGEKYTEVDSLYFENPITELEIMKILQSDAPRLGDWQEINIIGSVSEIIRKGEGLVRSSQTSLGVAFETINIQSAKITELESRVEILKQTSLGSRVVDLEIRLDHEMTQNGELRDKIAELEAERESLLELFDELEKEALESNDNGHVCCLVDLVLGDMDEITHIKAGKP